MPGRIGKSYARLQPAQAQAAPAPRSRHYGSLGVVIVLLSALGLLGWLIFR